MLVIVGIVSAYIALQTLDDIKKQTENSKVTADSDLLNAQVVIRAERSEPLSGFRR